MEPACTANRECSWDGNMVKLREILQRRIGTMELMVFGGGDGVPEGLPYPTDPEAGRINIVWKTMKHRLEQFTER